MVILVMIICACTRNFKNDFNNSTEQLNSWSAKATFQQLCDGLFEYQEDSFVLNRILVEFRRRNISYMNCKQYGGER